MFSSRTQWKLTPNRLTQRLQTRRRAGLPILDLTESNPTRCGFQYPADEIFAALTGPESLIYEPSAKGLRPAREAVVAYYAEKGVTVDPEQMKVVFMNIVTNAFQAMPRGGSLKIDSRSTRDETIISFQDTGSGMDRKMTNNIFLPFKTTKANGTGLGLAQAYKVVSQHGGRFSIKSKKGKGTTVEVILPRT